MGDLFGGGGGGGSGIGGLFGGGGATTSPFGPSQSSAGTQTPDPTSAALNTLRANEIANALGATGGYSTLLGDFGGGLGQWNLYAPNQWGVVPTFDNAIQMAALQQGLSPEQWYNLAVSGIDPTMAQAQMASVYEQGLQRLDPNAAISASQDYLSQILTPQLQNQYALMGLGRSGAAGEAISRAGVELALPIALQNQQQQGSLIASGAGNIAGLWPQYLANLLNINAAYPSVDTSLRAAELGRLQTGYNQADIPRQLALLRANNLASAYSSVLNNSPYNAGNQTTGAQYGNAVNSLTGSASNMFLQRLLRNQSQGQNPSQYGPLYDPSYSAANDFGFQRLGGYGYDTSPGDFSGISGFDGFGAGAGAGASDLASIAGASDAAGSIDWGAIGGAIGGL